MCRHNSVVISGLDRSRTVHSWLLPTILEVLASLEPDHGLIESLMGNCSTNDKESSTGACTPLSLPWFKLLTGLALSQWTKQDDHYFPTFRMRRRHPSNHTPILLNPG